MKNAEITRTAAINWLNEVALYFEKVAARSKEDSEVMAAIANAQTARRIARLFLNTPKGYP